MFLRSSRRWRDVAPKTPGHIRFPSCRFLQMYYSIVPGVSEVTFLAKKERRNTGGINSPVRANWMGQEVPPRCGYMEIFLCLFLLRTLSRYAAKHYAIQYEVPFRGFRGRTPQPSPSPQPLSVNHLLPRLPTLFFCLNSQPYWAL